MRKIERDIVRIADDFVNRGVTGACQRTKRDRIEATNGFANVYLWNTRIAAVQDEQIALWSGGYRTVTTKSRLNALLQLTNSHLYIYQKNFAWFVHDSLLDETVEFKEGMTFTRFK